tara:strand:+ start:30087 stop:31298 length:1212 start_codon:yes stop_codon:yes gene_type:complete
MTGALSGVTVLDLTQMMSGPFCTMMLADQGADVIKIEPPTGEVARGYGPFLDDDEDRHYGGYFQSINRNKRSISIDLKTEAGCAVFRRLVADADVVIENFRAGVMERLGLPYEDLAAINPRLVYATIRGFGDSRAGISPYQDWPAYDIVAQAMGGLMHMTGPEEGPPTKVGPGVGDTVTAMFTAFGVLAAVIQARESGKGQFVDVAMLDSIFALCERAATFHGYDGSIAGAVGNHHPFFTPFGTYPCRDGWVAIGCPVDRFWTELARLMGDPEIGSDPRYAANDERVARRQEVDAIVTNWTRDRTKAELADLIGGKVPFGPVNNIGDLADDPHLAARSMLAELPHPGSERTVTVANTPIKLTGTPGGARRQAPTLGEDTDIVLRNAGYADDEIAAMREAGTVR